MQNTTTKYPYSFIILRKLKRGANDWCSYPMWRDLRKGTLTSQRRFYRKRKRIVNEPIRASDILYSLLRLTNTVEVTLWEERERIRTYFELLMEKVLPSEKYCIRNYSHFIILKSDIELIWNDHNPKNNFLTLKGSLSQITSHMYFETTYKFFWMFEEP